MYSDLRIPVFCLTDVNAGLHVDAHDCSYPSAIFLKSFNERRSPLRRQIRSSEGARSRYATVETEFQLAATPLDFPCCRTDTVSRRAH